MERNREVLMHADSRRALDDLRRELNIALGEKNSLASAQEKFERDRARAVYRAAHAEGERAAQILALEGKFEKLGAENLVLKRKVDNCEGRLVRFGEGPPWIPNGHFYSPIAPRHEIEEYCARAFGSFPRTLPYIDLREDEQLEFVEINQ